jgi:hypothetical protein
MLFCMGKPLPNLLSFVSSENEQFMVSLANDTKEMAFIARLQALYEAALPDVEVPEDDMPIFQLLTFTHYYFLTATAMLMRCHLSEAFGCARIAIDATLIGAYLISDRKAHVAFTKREKPFDNFARYLGNLIKDGKPLPDPLVPELIRLQKTLSTFTSHADIGAFTHRVDISNVDGQPQIRVQYFQFSKTPAERQIHALTLFHIFVMVLDVFSEFLALEHRIVQKEWQFEIVRIGTELEREVKALRPTLPPDMVTDPNSTADETD